MKKKIAALLEEGTLTGNQEFSTLQKAHQTAKRATERAKKEKNATKSAHREALNNGEKDQDRLLELFTAFQQAKYMHRFHRAGLKLRAQQLTRWAENWLKNSEVPHAPEKQRAASPKKKKTTKVTGEEKARKNGGKAANSAS